MKIKVLLCVYICFFAVFFTGCAKEINTITDFSKYMDMTTETDKIEVTFDNYSGFPFYFTIEDKEDIDAIMNIIFSSSFENRGSESFAADNTTICIVQGNKEFNMHVRFNKEGKNYYAFTTAELQNKIKKLAEKAGAYDDIR